MPAPVIIYLDTTNRRQIGNFLSAVGPLQGLVFEAGDTVPVQLHFLQQNTASTVPNALPYSYIDPASVLPVNLGIGTIGAAPTAGTFTVTFGANTTAALAYNITAASLSTALNALASVTSAGGVAVVGNAGGPFTITFLTAGAIATLFTVNAGLLAPASQGVVGVSVTGETGVNEVQVITLLQNPAALLSTWTATYGAVVVTRLQAGGTGVNEIQRVTMPVSSYGGSFALTFGAAASNSLAYNITAAALQAALQAVSTIGTNNVQVIQSSPTTYDVTFVGTLAGAGQSLMTASSAGLLAPMYLAGSLNLNVQGIFNLLNGLASISTTLQIQQGSTGAINTVLQTSVTINNTLIVGNPEVPPPIAIYESGQIAVVAGTQAYTLTFPSAFANPPSFIGTQYCIASSSGEFLDASPDYSTLTAAGVTIRLDGVPTSASTGAYIKWLAFP